MLCIIRLLRFLSKKHRSNQVYIDAQERASEIEQVSSECKVEDPKWMIAFTTNLSTPVCIVDAQGKIIHANCRFKQVFDLRDTESRYLGTHFNQTRFDVALRFVNCISSVRVVRIADDGQYQWRVSGRLGRATVITGVESRSCTVVDENVKTARRRQAIKYRAPIH
jgi:transcriptional regulator with PAS, ATPase and Fis domain